MAPRPSLSKSPPSVVNTSPFFNHKGSASDRSRLRRGAGEGGGRQRPHPGTAGGPRERRAAPDDEARPAGQRLLWGEIAAAAGRPRPAAGGDQPGALWRRRAELAEQPTSEKLEALRVYVGRVSRILALPGELTVPEKRDILAKLHIVVYKSREGGARIRDGSYQRVVYC